jgi:diphosphomevalonate decarboxylase
MNVKCLDKLLSPRGEITWSAPSNLALVKYWGKDGLSPMNPSISFVLKNSVAVTRLKWQKGKGKFSFFLNNEKHPPFYPKIEQLLDRLKKEGLGELSKMDLQIYSKNTFPHSVGIASSAAGICSVTLAILSMFLRPCDKFWRKASLLAGLGSGSAARSVYPGYAVWRGGSARPIKVGPIFSDLQDAILVVSSVPKDSSSSYGHGLMKRHPFRNARIKWARQNLTKLRRILQGDDFGPFASVVEQEALILQALMMTSVPPLLYLKANSLAIIEIIRSSMKKCAVTYTMDAGANIHLLYPKSVNISPIINKIDHLVEQIIYDEVGHGPQLLR